MRKIIACSLVVSLVAPYSIAAQEISDATYLARSFMGHCAQNVGRIDKIQAAARVLEFKKIEGDLAAMFAPQDPNAFFEGWFVTGESPQPFILGVAIGEIDDREYAICTVSNPNTDIEAVRDEIDLLANFGTLLDDTMAGGQRYRVWETSEIAERSFVTVIDAKKMGINGGTVSLSAPSEK